MSENEASDAESAKSLGGATVVTEGVTKRKKVSEASSAAAKKRGKGSKPKAGEKFCSPCNTCHVKEVFPSGKNMCGKAFNAHRNIAAAAKAQDKSAWFNEVSEDPVKLRIVIQAYLVRVSPEASGLQRCKKGSFCIATYQVEAQRATDTLT